MKHSKIVRVRTLEGLSIKDYKTFPSHEWGDDGGMQADIYLKGTLVGTIFDAGEGGMADFYPTSTADIKSFKEACFKFLKRKDKDYFKYEFMPKQASAMNEDDYVCVVDLIASFNSPKWRTI